jgi:uncharacterized protein RhaS with RHS repeats
LTGLYYYRARWYDAQVGRFISEDPIGFNGGDINLYAYVKNNPVNAIDPSGEHPVLVIAAAAALIILYPAIANGPGLGNPVYNNDPAREMVGDIPYMVIGGVTLSKLWGIIGRACSKGFRESPSGKWVGHPPSDAPRPPGWSNDWEWRYPEGTSTKSGPRWFDTNGGEWRWHPQDKWHQKGHWDHNPWDQWNSPWRNVE